MTQKNIAIGLTLAGAFMVLANKNETLSTEEQKAGVLTYKAIGSVMAIVGITLILAPKIKK